MESDGCYLSFDEIARRSSRNTGVVIGSMVAIITALRRRWYFEIWRIPRASQQIPKKLERIEISQQGCLGQLSMALPEFNNMAFTDAMDGPDLMLGIHPFAGNDQPANLFAPM